MNFSYDIVYKSLIDDYRCRAHSSTASCIIQEGTRNGEQLTKCLLCDCGGCDFESMVRHCDSDLHENKLQDLYDDLHKVMMTSYRACRLFSQPIFGELAMLDQISHAAWKDSVQAELYRYLVVPNQTDMDMSAPEEFELLERPTKKLKTCLQNERLTLLGLAVWKAECIRQVPSVVMDYYTIQQWMSSGWKACKPEQRASNAMPIIVSAVRSFLE
jgi:hypothetical protein